ncbi:hypothetical protein G0Q06_06235 [Puniceicoccales bacterium CK1056]|uniref:LTXXQ motif family protein n=1 Tax=Oceanipulchritudo coccoides TaxID=2706888 RepID=A0A6B2M183_9BACT|nr:hypothetical protein [Oceanipulchritudo coccoides]NDV62039.1 hypothetical protein [Oceanipulchritudo coccoides]
MKKLFITLISMGLLLGSAQGQMQGPGFGDGTGDGPGDGSMMFDPPADLDPEVLAEITELHDAVKAIRAELRVSRAAVIEALGPDATHEEKVAALTVWREDNSDTFGELRVLTEELRTLIQENRPDRPVIDIPEDILADREALKARRIALAESRREAILALGENPTDEAVREAIEAWRAENADEIEAVRVLAKSLRDWFRENRPGRDGRVMTPRMLQRRLAFRDNVKEMRTNRLELREQMQDPALTDEERKALMQEFRQEQGKLMRERKQLKREERIQQGEGGGDRRPGG